MSESRIPRMANQIAIAFAARREAEQIPGVAGHINDFWAPPMRRELLDRVAADPAAFHPLVRAAAPLIRDPGRAAA